MCSPSLGRTRDKAEKGSFLSPEFSAELLGDRIRKEGTLEVSRGPPAHSSVSIPDPLSIHHSLAAQQDSTVLSSRVCHTSIVRPRTSQFLNQSV